MTAPVRKRPGLVGKAVFWVGRPRSDDHERDCRHNENEHRRDLMRHTWATNFMRVPGASLLELERQGGWQRWEQVERYSHAVPHHDRRTLPNPLGVQKTAFGQLPSTRVSRLSIVG